MRRSLLASAALMMTAGQLAACGWLGAGQPDSSASSGRYEPSALIPVSRDPVTLRVAWWGGQNRNEYTLKVIERYESEHPNVKIQAEYASFDDQWKKLAPQAAAGVLPDVIQMDISYLTQYAEHGQLADLSPYAENGLIDLRDIGENTLSGGRVDGRLYALPIGSNALMAAADIGMLEKAGVAVPQSDWSWDDFSRLGSALGSQGKLLTSDLRHDVFFPFYLRSQGQHMYAADGKALGYADDKYFVDFYRMYADWYDRGFLLSLDKLAHKKGMPEDGEMELGKAAFAFEWSNQYILSSAVAGRPLRILPVPGWNENRALYLKPSMYLSIAANSKAKEEAAEFIDFWVNDIEANKIILGERGVPVSFKVKEALKPYLPPEQTEVFDFVSWAERQGSPMDPPSPAGAVEVDKLLNSTVEEMLFGKSTVEEAAKRFREEANAILAGNGE
ncbi:ABC transporter substrate-binding protein [Cohnella caldifontis]|uniref:ABC transporter substrate-binding protein n=1 Tax=Cohnella caldifontis TaxID=3027471 RepID=UPI0023EC9A9D|nr:extracellular solute-binding protein [Cohnella sp. YIM B05605]